MLRVCAPIAQHERQKKRAVAAFATTALISQVSLDQRSRAGLRIRLANVGNSRHLGAELQRSGLFTTASAESDGNDSGSENDSALHGSISCCVPISEIRTLASHFRGSRNLGAELQRSRFFTTASAECNSDESSRENDQPLHTLHGLIS